MKTKRKILGKPKVSNLTSIKRMTPAELRKLPLDTQRVIIAKDALSLLRTKKISSLRGSYIETTLDFRCDDQEHVREGDVLVIDLIREEWKKKQSYCHVCQIGSLFIAGLDIFNSLSLRAIGCCEPGGKDMISYLEKWWTQRELRIMELAFEGNWQGTDAEAQDENGDYAEDFQYAEAFYKVHHGGDDRMIAILKNIIKNNGSFQP